MPMGASDQPALTPRDAVLVRKVGTDGEGEWMWGDVADALLLSRPIEYEVLEVRPAEMAAKLRACEEQAANDRYERIEASYREP